MPRMAFDPHGDWKPGDDDPVLSNPITCPDCDGEGGEWVDAHSTTSDEAVPRACDRCGGIGSVEQDEEEACSTPKTK